ncbi:ferredoxin [Rhodococcus sp. MEB041]|uniref:ferredoxin n=1 Tax=Rhodococcus sp. MEB041 TaxID=3040323 RepID=UPI00254BE89F|nr:ferredoxin [Rhodococcus sp. MEB041]
MKIDVDSTRCEGYGFCEERAGDLVRLDEDGIPEILVDSVPEERYDAARSAVRSCPVAALRLAE